MRPRFALALVVLIGLLAAPSPAGSASRPQGPPDVHRAGIQPAGPAGVARPSRVPHLVRPGSDRRADAGPQTGSPARTGGPLAPTTLTVYDGVGDQEVVSPGDPTGALGVAYHLAAVNVRMNFFERVTGTALFPQAKRLKSLDTQIPASADDFDPKVVYDPYRQRFVLAFASATSTQSFLSIVVIPEGSEGTTGDWCVLHMSGDQVSGNGSQLADYPMLGFTEDRVTLTTNQFNYSSGPAVGAFQYVQLVSFQKDDLYDCTVDPVPIDVFSRNQTDDPDGSRAFTIVPGISTGGSPTVQYMASIDFNGATGKVILWRLRTVSGTLRLDRTQVSKGAMAYPPLGRQCGSTTAQNTKWDTGDLRLTSAFWDGGLGRLYTATAIRGDVGGGGDESVIRWWEIDPAVTLGNSRVVRKANIGASGRDAAWPSIATDGGGKLWVNYARAGVAGADECLAAYAAVVQPGTTSASSLLYRSGDQRYEFDAGPERWGDYTAITRDPVDPTTMAAYGAYPIDDGGGTTTLIWQQIIATLKDV